MRMRTTSGLVDCDIKNLEILFYHADGQEECRYWIDIETIQTPCHLSNWIYQLMGKNWVTPDVISDFLICVDFACLKTFGLGAQSVFGDPNKNVVIDWRRGIIE